MRLLLYLTSMEELLQSFTMRHNYVVDLNKLKFLYKLHPRKDKASYISDVLTLLGVSNMWIRIEQSQIINLPRFFIASERNGSIRFVKKTYSHFSCIDEPKQGFPISEFSNKFSGDILVLQKNDSRSINSLLYFISFYCSKNWPLVILGVLFLLNYIALPLQLMPITTALLIGALISRLAIFMNYDEETFITKKFCFGSESSKNSCKTLINADSSKIFGFKISELSLSIFLCALLFLYIPNSTNILISILAICIVPMFLYSVYHQVINRTFCSICTILFGILFFIILYGVTTYELYPKSYDENDLVKIAIFTLLFLIVFTLVNRISSIYSVNKSYDLKLIRLNQLKFSIKTFSSILTKSMHLPTFIEKNDNYTNRRYSVDIVLSKQCPNCISVYKESLSLLSSFSESLNLNYYFMDSNELSLKRSYHMAEEAKSLALEGEIAKAHILVENWKRTNPSFRTELKERYKHMDVPISSNDLKTWTQKNSVDYTPLVIINERELPLDYTVMDFFFYLSQKL